jgi:methylenetetrahydrofolate dehydrogenase (NADP+)/methenyltetrahydrofolate cyclohydrolase
MPARVIDGRKIGAAIRANVRETIERKGLDLTISSIIVGSDDASRVYLRQKEKACQNVGIDLDIQEVPEGSKEGMVIYAIDSIVTKGLSTGIIVEMPLPDQMDPLHIAEAIPPHMDLDGMNPVNYGRLLLGLPCLAPSTPLAVMEILAYEEVPLEGAHVTVVSHSNIIGKPLTLMLLNRNASVKVAHVYTKDLKRYTKDAEILITAAGVPDLITGDMVKEGAVVIDVSMNRVEGKLCGDVAADVKDRAGALTPVPGGVGPVTVATLMNNTLIAVDLQNPNSYLTGIKGPTP